MTKKCECGQIINNEKFCSNCGKPVPHYESIICPNCSTAVNDGFSFCPNCGTKVVCDLIICANCGTQSPSDMSFCMQCGTLLKQNTDIKDNALLHDSQQTMSIQEPIKSYSKSASNDINLSPFSNQNLQITSDKIEQTGKQNVKEVHKLQKSADLNNQNINAHENPQNKPHSKRKHGFLKFTAVLCSLAIIISIIYSADIMIKKKNRNISDYNSSSSLSSGSLINTNENNKSSQFIEYTEITAISSSSANVSSENNTALLEGAEVDFGSYNLSDEDMKLTVSKVTASTNQQLGNPIAAFDFNLGDTTQFKAHVTLNMPYNKENVSSQKDVCVMYYNENIGIWTPVPYEIDADTGEATVFTKHFSTFAMFEFDSNDPDNLKYVVSNVDYIRNLSAVTANSLFNRITVDSPNQNDFIDSGLGLLSVSASGYNHSVNSMKIAQILSENSAQLSTKWLGRLGMLSTAMQAGYQWYNGEGEKAAQTAVVGVMEAAADIALTYAGVTAAPIATAAVIGCWTAYYAYPYFSPYDVTPQIERNEYLLDLYQMHFSFYLTDENFENGFWVYSSPDYTNWSGEVYQAHKKTFTLGKYSKDGWFDFIAQVHEKYKDNPVKASEIIFEAVDSYCSQFWELDSIEQLKYTNYYDNDPDVAYKWEWPTVIEEEQLKKSYRNNLIIELTPVFDDFKKTLYTDMVNQYVEAVDAECNEMNSLISFEINDPLNRYEDYIFKFLDLDNMSKSSDWTFNGNTCTCTRISYIMQGLPITIGAYKPGYTEGYDIPTQLKFGKIDFDEVNILTVSEETEAVILKSGSMSPVPYDYSSGGAPRTLENAFKEFFTGDGQKVTIDQSGNFTFSVSNDTSDAESNTTENASFYVKGKINLASKSGSISGASAKYNYAYAISDNTGRYYDYDIEQYVNYTKDETITKEENYTFKSGRVEYDESDNEVTLYIDFEWNQSKIHKATFSNKKFDTYNDSSTDSGTTTMYFKFKIN